MTQLFSYSGLPRETNQDWFDENDEEIKEMFNASRKESSSQNLPTRPIICSQKDSFHQHSQDSRPTNQTTQDARLVARCPSR